MWALVILDETPKVRQCHLWDFRRVNIEPCKEFKMKTDMKLQLSIKQLSTTCISLPRAPSRASEIKVKMNTVSRLRDYDLPNLCP